MLRLSVMFVLVISSLIANGRGLPDLTELVEEKSPAVVKITTVSKSSTPLSRDFELPDNIPEIFRHFLDPRQMPERDARSMGSGFIISENGYVVTNNHVVQGATEINVRLIDRTEYKADIIGLDPQSDLALLKIEAQALPYLKLADSNKAKVGEWVLAIGSPFGLDYSVSAGIISAIGRNIPSDGRQNYVPFIQTDVAINPGNSGGPLFNLNGEVVGINSQIYTNSGGSIGLSFAIPSALAMDVIEQLKDKGKVDRGWLGVVIQDVDKNLALSFGLDKPQGALISQMERGGPAEKSGIKVGDIILEFNREKIMTSSDLPLVVGPVRSGSTVPVKIMRKGKKKTIDVTVGSRGGDVAQQVGSQSEQDKSRLGLVVEEIPAKMRESVGVEGVVVTDVFDDGPARAAGIQVGDIIVQLGFDEVSSVINFNKVAKSLPPNKPQPIRIIRRGSPLFRSIVIED